jgi:hypothetical protein
MFVVFIFLVLSLVFSRNLPNKKPTKKVANQG